MKDVTDEKLMKPDGTMTDPLSPDYYSGHPEGIECRKITQHFPTNLGNAIKYIWRSENMNKKLALRDLRKAKKSLGYEIERVEGGPERTLYRPFQGYQRPEVLAHDRAERDQAVRNDQKGSGGGGEVSERDQERQEFIKKWANRIRATDHETWEQQVIELNTDVLKLTQNTQDDDINRNSTEHGEYTTTGTDFKISGSELT